MAIMQSPCLAAICPTGEKGNKAETQSILAHQAFLIGEKNRKTADTLEHERKKKEKVQQKERKANEKEQQAAAKKKAAAEKKEAKQKQTRNQKKDTKKSKQTRASMTSTQLKEA